MAELLVCVKGQENTAEPVKTNQLYQAGDVIVAMPDGHPWSVTERTKQEWRILIVAGEAPEAFASLVTPEEDPKPADWMRRISSVDLTHAVWTAAEKSELDYANGRTNESSEIQESKIRAATVPRGRRAGGVIHVT
jgi:hypothetical protein